MHNCEEIFEHIYEFINAGDLSGETSHEIRAHLQMCRKCYTKYEFERRLIERFKQAGCISCPETLKSKIKSIIDSFE